MNAIDMVSAPKHAAAPGMHRMKRWLTGQRPPAQPCTGMHGTYSDTMPVAIEVRLERFRKWVASTLLNARERGMTDNDIRAATGLSVTTWHRWQSGKFGRLGPQPDAVYRFCDGLGLPRSEPAKILGWTGEHEIVKVDIPPEIPPDIRELLRRLRDPNVPQPEKVFISETIKSLVGRRYAKP
jgi:hypothetical protein